MPFVETDGDRKKQRGSRGWREEEMEESSWIKRTVGRAGGERERNFYLRKICQVDLDD